MTLPPTTNTILITAPTYRGKKGLIVGMLLSSLFFIFNGLTGHSSLGRFWPYIQTTVGVGLFLQIVISLAIDKFYGQKSIEFTESSICIKDSYFRKPILYAYDNIASFDQKGPRIYLTLKSPEKTFALPISEYWQLTLFKSLVQSQSQLNRVRTKGF